MAFGFGGTVIQGSSFSYPYQALELMVKEKVTGFPIVPAMAAMILRMRNLDRFNSRACAISPTRPRPSFKPYPRAAKDISPGPDLFHVRADGMQESHLPPSRRAQPPADIRRQGDSQHGGLYRG